VLPFANLSPDPDQDYLADGIAEEVTSTLARVPGLRVAARASAFRFRDPRDDLRRVASELRVDALLDGSLRRSGHRLRVTVQLVSGADGYQLWSETYDREMADVFAVQDDIAARVAAALSARLATGARRPPDMAAYHLYLRGLHAWNKRHQGGLRAALRLFEEAIDRDPAYAAAWAGVADTYGLLGLHYYAALPPETAMPRAKAAAQNALALDPTLAEAYAARAWVALHYDWDWESAEGDFQKSLSLDPSRATTHHWHSFLLSALSRHDEAAAAARRGWELDPLSSIVNANLAQPAYYARRFDEAAETCRRLTQLEPDFGIHHCWLGFAEAARGGFDAAVAAHRAHASLTGRRADGYIGNALARAGRVEEAQALLSALDEEARSAPVPPLEQALIHIGLGETDLAFTWLDRACDARSSQLPYLDVDALFDPLRADPRFARLRRRVGLPG
jgi:serine/threonine-protein kinase